MKKLLLVTVAILVLNSKPSIASNEDLIYGYKCQKNSCVKIELTEENFDKAISLPVCRMFCDTNGSIGTIWPRPKGPITFEYLVQQLDIDNIHLHLPNAREGQQLWASIEKRFVDSILANVPNLKVLKRGGHALNVTMQIETDANEANEKPKLTLDTDESYSLAVNPQQGGILIATINAKSFFGARHALETLSQLIVYDDIRREVHILAKANIKDAPAYQWRGLLLDTSRNYFDVRSIKRTLDGMAMVKLNRFHWHITDTHSFPFEVKSQPELYKLGAYSPHKVYSHEDIADIVEYGLARGISVIPEFDAPAHVGEGWQHKNMTACFRAQPWRMYCVEPPCGQLDPTVEPMYTVLEDIYREMFELFDPDVFHMGGDEVSVDCWNSSESIQSWMRAKQWPLTEPYFIRLWGHFQEKALERVDRVAGAKKPLITLWTSHLTNADYIDKYLNKDRYIIQVWTTDSDPVIQDILERGYRIIMSNYNALYFDCGGPGWVSSGTNWCSPYIGWQTVYDNSFDQMADKSLVLGAEAAIWSEQIDQFTLDARFWPRASALAERLWSNPKDSWRAAEARMLYHRERLVNSGIAAESLQPEWCLQNENQCRI